MADYNSTLPILGSVTISSSVLIGVSGTKLDSLVGSVTIGRAVEVSGGIFTGGDLVGSVVIEDSVRLGVSGTVDIGNRVAGSIVNIPDITIDGITAGSVEVFSSTGSVEMYGSLTATAGSEQWIQNVVEVSNTVATSAGAREDLVVDYKTTASIAAAAIGSHGYVSLGSLYVSRIMAGFSGKAKLMVLTSGTGTAPLVTGFNSTANPNINLDFGESNGLFFGVGSRVTLVMTNRDSAAQDVYSTIIGYYTDIA